MCAHACICLYLHTYSVHTRILTLIPHILKPIHTTQFSYRNNKTFVGSSAQDVARKSWEKSPCFTCPTSSFYLHPSPSRSAATLCFTNIHQWHLAGLPGVKWKPATDWHELFGLFFCRVFSLQSCFPEALAWVAALYIHFFEWRQFRDLSSSACAFRAKDEIDRGESQGRQEGLTAPRHPQVLAHSLSDMPINTGLHTFTYTHIHRSINISEKAAYQDTQEIHCHAHRCISGIAGAKKRGSYKERSGLTTASAGKYMWVIRSQPPTHAHSLPDSSWFLWAPLLPPEFLLHSKSEPPDSAVSHH